MGDRLKKIARAVKSVVKRTHGIKGEHEFKQTLTVDVWYPDHAARSNSATFNKTRDQMITRDQGSCYICGIREDLEAHHWHVEWAFASAVDWDRMRILHPDFNWDEFKEAEDFVDSPYNMMILCEKHHRHKNHGIHNLPYPIWIMQKNQKVDYQLFGPDDQG